MLKRDEVLDPRSCCPGCDSGLGPEAARAGTQRRDRSPNHRSPRLRRPNGSGAVRASNRSADVNELREAITDPTPVVPVLGEGERFTPLDSLGHQGYGVGTDGSVWTRWEQYSLGGRSGTSVRLGLVWKRLVASRERKSGYLSANLKGTRVRIHRLVLLAFVGPCPTGMLACHCDGDPANNSVENLRWDTPKGNADDADRHGTRARGQRIGGVRLTPSEVKAIRRECIPGDQNHGISAIARRLGMSVGGVRKVTSRINWAWLEDDDERTA